MKLKSRPEDFRVVEQLDFEEDPEGEFRIHKLHKEKLSTHEALSAIVERARVPREDITYAGLKDRQAVTEQFVAIRGRAVDLKLANLRLRAVGRSARPITSKMSRGNRFTIVVRDLDREQAVAARRNLPSVVKTGYPNYFDDQRFGCVRHGQGFALRELLQGRPEQALKQLIATPSAIAVSGDVKLKTILKDHWGDWARCGSIARGPVYRPVFEHLVRHPDDFVGALERLPTRVKLIHAYAFQSALWNNALSHVIAGRVPFVHRLWLPTEIGRLAAWRNLERESGDFFDGLETPLYGPDGTGGHPVFQRAMADELQKAGVTAEDFRARKVSGMVLVEEPRAPVVRPTDVERVRMAPDDDEAGRFLVQLEFSLPRGAYATMLLKRLFATNEMHSGRRRADPRE